jgi:perosamine synthetase
MPLHLHPYYRQQLGCEPSDLPCAAAIYPELITLPLYPDMTTGDVEYVCDNLKAILTRSKPVFSGADLLAGR